MSQRAVRIDSTGTVHPIGRAAGQGLRAKAGEWTLSLLAHDVIVMRREGGAMLRLCGEITSPGAICDVIALAAQSNWSGELVVLSETSQRTIFLDAGAVIAAQTNVEEERLGETLYRFGVLTREQANTAVETSKQSGKRIGEVAVELGFITQEQLYPMMARQVEEVFLGAIQVDRGIFYFFDRFDERAIGRRHNLPAGALLMEAARRMDEMRFFRDKVPNDDYVPVPSGGGKRVPDECASVFAQVDGKRSVADIGRAVGMLEFEVTRAVFQLINAGCVYMVAPRPKGAVAIVEAFNPGLAAIHRRCDLAGRGGELRDGLGRFAMGAGIYEPLFMGAGPMDDGTLGAAGVARNLGALAGEDPDAWLIQQLNEYTGFALFQAGSLLAREEEEELVREVAELLKAVKPNVDDAALGGRSPSSVALGVAAAIDGLGGGAGALGPNLLDGL
jgi:hypothetical protein